MVILNPVILDPIRDKPQRRISNSCSLGIRLVIPLLLATGLIACNGGSTDTPSSTPTTAPPVSIVDSAAPLADGSASFVAEPLEFSVAEDERLSNQLSASSVLAPTGELNFSTISLPEFGELELSLDGQFVYTPSQDFFGNDSFDYYSWIENPDGSLVGSTPATVKITVAPVADFPTIAGSPVFVIEQSDFYDVQFVATDVDGDTLQFWGTNLPDWLILDAETGQLVGRPLQTDVGLHEEITIHVADSGGLQASYPSFVIEVLDINDSPTVNPIQFPDRLDAREMVSINVFPDDADGDRVTLTAEPNDFVDVFIEGGRLDVTAKDVIEVTQINLVVIATDRLGSVTRQILPITLYPLTASGLGRTLLGKKSGSGVHLVVLGEGYKEDEMVNFEEHTRNLINLMSADPWIRPHLTAWNVHMVSTPSIDSGIDDNPLEDVRDTVFNASYNCRQLPRLVCAEELLLFDVSLDEYPYLDQLVLLVNDRRYGGSGGSVAIASAFAPEIALHEMGHSIAGLADEYVDSLVSPPLDLQYSEGRFRNVSVLNDPDRVPWTHWIDSTSDYPSLEGQPGVGVFEGAHYQSVGFYRPTTSSRMRDNLAPFGPVNGEQWALSVYRMTNAILDFGPVARSLSINAGQRAAFHVSPLFDEQLQSVQWTLDGQLLEGQADPHSISILPTAGSHQLELTVTDISGLIRKTPPHSGVFNWVWELTVQ